MKIFLDDDPVRDSWVDDTWTIVRTASEAWELLQTNVVEEISLDHDLGNDNDGTGYTIIRFLERWAFDGRWFQIPEKITIHSANPVGRKNMQAAIDSIERMRNA